VMEASCDAIRAALLARRSSTRYEGRLARRLSWAYPLRHQIQQNAHDWMMQSKTD
jgi:hypothetical protein